MFIELNINASFYDWFSFIIQDYYKSGMIRCPPSVTVRELREACDYLLIPFDANTVKCQNLRKWIFVYLPQFILTDSQCWVFNFLLALSIKVM